MKYDYQTYCHACGEQNETGTIEGRQTVKPKRCRYCGDVRVWVELFPREEGE